MKLAVISDLHIGDAARGKDFSPVSSDNASVDNYLEQFTRFITTKGIQADYLLVPGDITNRAETDEFNLASTIIENISTSFSIPNEKIIFCPGNHDANWTVVERLEGVVGQDAIDKAKYSSLLDENSIFGNSHRLATGRFDEHPFFVTWSFSDLLALSLNSAIFDEPSTSPHQGQIKTEQLEALDEQLSRLSTLEDNRLKILILHHHPFIYHDETFSAPDLSAMVNAEGLLNILSQHGFDFIVHGHKHTPRFKMNINSHGYPLWALCAGSFSARLDDRYFGGIGNSFHLIDFHDRCETKRYYRGELNSWSWLSGHGWIESNKKFGIDHKHFFGEHSSPEELKSILRETISHIFSDKDHILWNEIIVQNRNIGYFTNEMLSNALDSLAEEMGFIVHCKERLNINETVLIKGS